MCEEPCCANPRRANLRGAAASDSLEYNLLAARLMAAADKLSRLTHLSSGDYYDAVRYRNEIDSVAAELQRMRGERP